jgi:hypothetical protein
MSTRARPPLFAIKHSRTNAGSRLNFQAERQTAGQRRRRNGRNPRNRSVGGMLHVRETARENWRSGKTYEVEIMIEAGRIYQCARVRC